PAPGKRLVEPDPFPGSTDRHRPVPVARPGGPSDNTTAPCRVPEAEADGIVRGGPAKIGVVDAVRPRHALLARPPRPGSDADVPGDAQAPRPAVRLVVPR